MRKLLLLVVCLFSFGCIEVENKKARNIKTIEIEEVRTFKVESPKEIGKPINENPAVINLSSTNGVSISNSTGFFINYKERTYLITARHSVEHGRKISALHTNTGVVSFTIIKHELSENHDIAAFLIESKNKLNCLFLSD